jgi:hypothetical protein
MQNLVFGFLYAILPELMQARFCGPGNCLYGECLADRKEHYLIERPMARGCSLRHFIPDPLYISGNIAHEAIPSVIVCRPAFSRNSNFDSR